MLEFLDAATGEVLGTTASEAGGHFFINDLPFVDQFRFFKIRAIDPLGYYPTQYWLRQWTFAAGTDRAGLKLELPTRKRGG